MKKILKLDFSKESVPDATRLPKFRQMLEENEIGAKIFDDEKDRLDRCEVMSRCDDHICDEFDGK